MVKYIVWALDLDKTEIAKVNEDYEKGLCIGMVAGGELYQDLLNKGLKKDMLYYYLNWEESQWNIEGIRPRSVFVTPSLIWLSIRDGGVFTLIKRLMEAVSKGLKKVYFNAIGAYHDKIDFLKLIAILNSFVEAEIIEGYGLNTKTPGMMNFPDVVHPIFLGKSFALVEGQANDDDTFEETFVQPMMWFKSPCTEVVIHTYTSTGDEYWSDKVPEIVESYDVALSVFKKDKLYKVWEYNRGKGY